MNRIDYLFQTKKERVLSIYVTAGFPNLEDTLPVMEAIQAAGADIIELGIPYSDPIADGPTIQESNTQALENGMSIKTLFSQLLGFRAKIHVPVILMGYLNPIMQFGVVEFCKKCKQVGIDGLILPDLPMSQYLEEYKALFEEYGLFISFLISPQTSEKRIREVDEHSSGFIYMVSSHAITGAKSAISKEQEVYFERVAGMNLNHPRLIGFGISDAATFQLASRYSQGAIIGSALIKHIAYSLDLNKDIHAFIKGVLTPE
ncbi:MAG: tryptophan synthase subunit alpha [Algoriphagus sp.]|nr:tryptophan synthase subunit alpha [Algoriphagus sp.]